MTIYDRYQRLVNMQFVYFLGAAHVTYINRLFTHVLYQCLVTPEPTVRRA